jgi:hypothetical protein
MDEEIRFHVEMETDRLIREEGLESREARRQALRVEPTEALRAE